jgi:hypothetical protein
MNESVREPLEQIELLPESAVEEGAGSLVVVGEVGGGAGTEEVVVVAREVGVVALPPGCGVCSGPHAAKTNAAAISAAKPKAFSPDRKRPEKLSTM